MASMTMKTTNTYGESLKAMTIMTTTMVQLLLVAILMLNGVHSSMLDQEKETVRVVSSPLVQIYNDGVVGTMKMIKKKKETFIFSGSTSSSSLRGGHNDKKETQTTQAVEEKSTTLELELPPIPPIHPHHSGSVHYSSIMNGDNNSILYRREIQAPCDYGMLVFTVGAAAKDLPYEYDLYGEAYLWSDNSGLCIFYPTYDGYQTSSSPFWKLGIDPMEVNFTNLIPNPSSMHRISSRQISVGASPIYSSDTINTNKLGDYIIMAHHNFYSINYYKQLKAFINSWKSNEDGSISSGVEDGGSIGSIYNMDSLDSSTITTSKDE